MTIRYRVELSEAERDVLTGVLYTSRGIALLAAPPLLALGITLLGSHAMPVLAAALLGMAGTALLARVRRRD